MSKPRLLVLQGRRNFRLPTYVESPAVRKYFDVSKTTTFKVKKGKVKPDLIYCQAYGPFHEVLARCRNWGIPYIIHVGGSPWFEMAGEQLRRTEKIMGGAKAVVCNSRYLHGEFITNIPGAENLQTLPDGLWGLDHTPLGPSPSRFTPKTDYQYGGRPVVVMAMNLRYSEIRREKWRGVEILFDAIKDMETPRGKPTFICAGRNDENFPLLEGWNKKCELHVHSSHYLDDNKDVWPDVLRDAVIFVHPSMKDFWPRAIGDAMCAAMPSLVFDVAGCPEVGDNVVLVDPKDPTMIHEAFRRLLMDRQLREETGRQARLEAVRRTEEHRGDYAELLLGMLEL